MVTCKHVLPTTALSGAEESIDHQVGRVLKLAIDEGDLLDQDVEVIVNAWNRKIILWWLLLPQGAFGAIKRRAGTEPFRELARKGPIPLGGATETSAGRLPFCAIIHVAGLNLFWRPSERAIRGCVGSALRIARERGYRSIAFPLIGTGTGGVSVERGSGRHADEARSTDYAGEVRLVRFRAHI